MVKVTVLEYKKEQELEDIKVLPPFFLRTLEVFRKLLILSSLIALPNWHSTAFSVFTFLRFSVIIWIAPSSWYFVGFAVHIIPDLGAVLLSIHQINAEFRLISQAFKHIFDVGSLSKVIRLSGELSKIHSY